MNSRVEEKLRKLFALAEGTPYQAEAELAVKMAHELMQKHRVPPGVLRAIPGQKTASASDDAPSRDEDAFSNDEIVGTDVKISRNSRLPHWRFVLANAIGDFLGLCVIRIEGHGEVQVWGTRKEARLFASLYMLAGRQIAAHCKSFVDNTRIEGHLTAAKNAFKVAAAESLHEALLWLREDYDSALKPDQFDAVLEREARIRAIALASTGELSPIRPPNHVGHAQASLKGAEAGRRVARRDLAGVQR